MSECVGCGKEGASERLWLAAPLGLCSVLVHRDRTCAEAARELRGGGKFVQRPRTKEETKEAYEAALRAQQAPPEEQLPPILRPGWKPPSRRLL